MFNFFKRHKKEQTESHSLELADRASDLEKLNAHSRAESMRAYADYQKCLSEAAPTINLNAPLSCVEKAFLKYVAGQAINMQPAQYWYYDYGLKYLDEEKKFLHQGLITISSFQGLTSLKVTELKSLLSDSGLSATGKKAELIDRIHTNIPLERIEAYFQSDDKYFVLTPKGQLIVNSVVDSATKDVEFEDTCLSLIESGDFRAATKLIAKHRAGKPGKFGVGIDWNEAAASDSYFTEKILVYQGSSKSTSDWDYLKCIILGDMLGAGDGGIKKIIKRLHKKVDKDRLEAVLYTYQTIGATQEIKRYADHSVEKYQILGCGGADCPTCTKYDGKVYAVSRAVVGKNFPPFHPGCRCTTAPHYKDF